MDVKEITEVWVATKSGDVKEIVEAAANKMWKCYGVKIKNIHINSGFWHNDLYHCQVFFKQDGGIS